MPQLAGFTWPDTLDAIIHSESSVAGVPLDLSYTFIGAESSFNPNEHVDNALEDSVGLLQLNRRGGQGVGHTVAELLDPRRNLQIGLPYIRRAFELVWRPAIPPAEFIWRVSALSGHPGDVPAADVRITRIKSIWAQFYPAAGLSLEGPAGVVGGGHAPAPWLAAAMAIPMEVFALPLLVATLIPTSIEAFIGAGNLASLFTLKPVDPDTQLRRLAGREGLRRGRRRR